jgi:hypothetical protein
VLTILAFLVVTTPFAAPSPDPSPTIELAPSAPQPSEPPSSQPPPPAPAPSEAPTPAPFVDPADEPPPATELAEIEAEHETGASHESFDLQPPAAESAGFIARRRHSSVWGQSWLSVSILAGLDRFGVGVGAVRFVVPRIGFGLDLDDTIVFYRGPYNRLQITPKVVFLLLPNRRLTPIASGGFGGTFYSHGAGVYGRWVAGAGLMIAIREHLRFGFGLDVQGLMPKARFYQHFECIGDALECHTGLLAPWVSFGFRA